MKIVINGKKTETPNELTITGLLSDQAVKMPEMVSVELNGDIIKKTEFDKTMLGEGDQVEFLYFMGGGACDLLFKIYYLRLAALRPVLHSAMKEEV